ncbi:Oxygen-independent coproporphyrinogen-III oxidase [Actinomyces bovis]|uniref:Heme chaperone HemW n=1 Tax=Actinomyces bovis TaxID=1658 RepID=A0ABY1VK99_9ACTO|nr:radical SAM family heme chaperone HemW [Actinomyces bovis]SPT52510.1 Oxygen-independent coproporphyrinogen-III oxidase [Actinomyces bovis]VEG54234.1 Oxygen-independent coproporphyrinogen-III oxidase [Actinomyces israelii]
MSPAQPEGEPLGGSGALPEQVVAADGQARPFSVYLHVPYCRVRCGYCDFNTYTNLSMGAGASLGDYVDTLAGELRLARLAMDTAGLPQRIAQTVFLGGGTPTMLPAADLARMLELVRQTWGLAKDVEVTTEANPETVDERYLATLAAAGFTRVSFGMQSAVPEVLAVLDRTHRPERVPQVIQWARRAGLSTSVDLIYGAPGESMADWRRSLEVAVEMEPEHISAYGLVIEEGTKMRAQVLRGELQLPADDDEAAKYELADQMLAEAGYEWYEISNWARPGQECRHNEAYWRDWDWWGAGPGAHSHLGEVRFWNVKHPVAWAGQVVADRLPVAGHEVVEPESRRLEQVMLGIRLREGLALADLVRGAEPTTATGAPKRLVPTVAQLVSEGLVEAKAALAGRIVLTLHGRLLADAVTRSLVG